ncbi:MAG: hypothetical protein AB8B56_22115 [Crocinitomicaceae bacterium]
MRLTLLLLICSSLTVLAQDFTPPQVDSNEDSNVFPVVIWECGCGMEAHYAGGSPALSKYVNEQINLSSDIQWGNTTRVRAYVQFIVEKDGSLSGIHVSRTNFPETNESILNVFYGMTNWIAGEYDCKSTRTRVRVPVCLTVQ